MNSTTSSIADVSSAFVIKIMIPKDDNFTINIIFVQVLIFKTMKKIIIFIAAIAFGVTVSAQHKGDFSVGGALGVSGGSFKTTVKYIGKSTSESTPSTVDFILNPYFNYFVIDNLELNAGLGYSMKREFYDKDEDTGKNYYTFTHTALFQIGAHYFVPLVGGILYYTPGINVGFGGGSYVSPSDDDNIVNSFFDIFKLFSKLSNSFLFILRFLLFKFSFNSINSTSTFLYFNTLIVSYFLINTKKYLK